MQAPSHVTTTSAIDGWRVETYLGVVASHVVAGTGFGSDFMAGLSDLFGGRSGTYQNQLASLYGEAISELHRRAQQLGGNWIIGLRVDIDEVSGKGMQMFMVTAMGTAVRASMDPSVQQSISAGASSRHAGVTEVRQMQRRLEIAEAVKAKELLLEDETWEFIVEQRVEEAAAAVLDWMVRIQGEGSWQYVEASNKRRPWAYFQSLPVQIATQFLHEALCGDPPVAKAAMGIMRDLSLMSLRTSLEGLRSTNLDLRHRVVQVLGAHQQYEEADTGVMDQLISELPKAFPGRPDVIQTKGLLGGTKDRWQCDSCGQKNDLGAVRCGKCERDVQGFGIGELTPAQAVELLKDRRRALSALLRTQLSGGN